MAFNLRLRGAALAALASAVLLGSCASNQAEEQAEAVRIAAEQAALAARQPRPISLNSGVIQSAANYLSFARDMATIRGGFGSPEEIQAALRRGAAYDPVEISRGIVAYASVLALQSPEFVAGVQPFGTDLETRNQVVARIVANPAYASTLPGADAAAGLIIAAMDRDIDALRDAADSIENDAYAIQADGRRSWGAAAVLDREGRLQSVKDISGRGMLASPEQAARLSAAAFAGSGLGVSADRRRTPPYPPAVENALAIAALALLDGAGENARSNTDALMFERASQDCLVSSKLNLFQCLAAARPSYEDVFCLGRHVVRDLGSCARGAALPSGVITVGAPTQSRVAAREIDVSPDVLRTQEPVAPAIETRDLTPAPSSTAWPPAPQTQDPGAAPTQSLSPTQRLNSGAAPPN